jgi:uncharacterized integral membrane protein (TIGR00698 family)
MALVAGIIFSFFLGNPYPKLSQKAINVFLKVAVVGFGFGINIHEAISISKESIWLTAGSILIVMISGYLLAKLLELNKGEGHLITSGTAICGGSAIAAIAPITGASNQEISVSLGVVFLLNSISLLIFPPIGHFLNLSEFQFGMWSAVAIHDTSSVIGAAHAYGQESLKVATTVKMARVLWIIPISIYSIFLFKSKNTTIKIPWFILLFICAIIANSYFSIYDDIKEYIAFSSNSLLIVTLFLIGMSLSIARIRASGWRVLIFAVSLWVIAAVFSLVLIIN